MDNKIEINELKVHYYEEIGTKSIKVDNFVFVFGTVIIFLKIC